MVSLSWVEAIRTDLVRCNAAEEQRQLPLLLLLLGEATPLPPQLCWPSRAERARWGRAALLTFTSAPRGRAMVMASELLNQRRNPSSRPSHHRIDATKKRLLLRPSAGHRRQQRPPRRAASQLTPPAYCARSLASETSEHLRSLMSTEGTRHPSTATPSTRRARPIPLAKSIPPILLLIQRDSDRTQLFSP